MLCRHFYFYYFCDQQLRHFFLYFRLPHKDQCGCRTSPHVLLHCSPSLEERGQPGGADLSPRQRGTDPSGPGTGAEKDGRKAPPVLAGIRAKHPDCILAKEWMWQNLWTIEWLKTLCDICLWYLHGVTVSWCRHYVTMFDRWLCWYIVFITNIVIFCYYKAQVK